MGNYLWLNWNFMNSVNKIGKQCFYCSSKQNVMSERGVVNNIFVRPQFKRRTIRVLF